MNSFRTLIVMYVFIVASLAFAVDDFNKPPAYSTAREKRAPGVVKRKAAKRAARANRRGPAGNARRAEPRYAAPALTPDNASGATRSPASEDSLVTDPTVLAPPEDNYGSTEGSN
ncbi:MAG: hypothetical protein ABL958_01465 [Bdellovibrionia bacterium]